MNPSIPVNPLLQVRFQIPFDQIRAEHVEPAVAELLRDARERLDRITSKTAPPSFANTMDVLGHLTERLAYAMGITTHVKRVLTTQDLAPASHAVPPRPTASD